MSYEVRPADLLDPQQDFRVSRPIEPSMMGPADIRVNTAPHEAMFMPRKENPVDLNRLSLSTGDVLRLARQGGGKGITEFAGELNLTKGYISLAESAGNKSRPNTDLLMRYEEHLGLEPGLLVRAAVYHDPTAIESLVTRTGVMDSEEAKEYAFKVKKFYESGREVVGMIDDMHRRIDEILSVSSFSPDQVEKITEHLTSSLKRMMDARDPDQVDSENGKESNLEAASLSGERARLENQLAELHNEVAELRNALNESDRTNSELRKINEEKLEVVRSHLQAGLAATGEDSESSKSTR